MTRVQGKIKDFVELQGFDEVPNVAADPHGALAAYRFTDATADLLARWLDALADLPRGRGTARALAGIRGVGKSHLLTVFTALAAYPELRPTVSDAHVATSARRLLARRAQVARVERGTAQTLEEELAIALSSLLDSGDVSANVTQEDPMAMLATAASRLYDGTLVLIIDTAFDRPARVERNDGPLLAALAEAARNLNVFVALALDDDIAGAEGVNVALAKSFQIDYLDPEHLYRVADAYVLRKTPQGRTAIHEIYLSLRQSLPGFNWSEPRFTALYPLHPLIADVAAAVRFYAPRFALLPFAAEASLRAAPRPSLSLVLLDEVFDRTERELREAKNLKNAFEIYDRLAGETVALFPIMQRLEAKLILKALFILSLDERGATPRELCAAMLFSDEAAPDKAIARAAEMLGRFADAAPQGTLLVSEEAGESRYRLQIDPSSDFDNRLAAAVEPLRSETNRSAELLQTAARTRFEDWPLTYDGSDQADMNFYVAWRNQNRRGRIVKKHGDDDVLVNLVDLTRYDWEVVISDDQTFDDTDAAHSGVPIKIKWQPAPITVEENEVIYRLLALRADPALIADFGDRARTVAAVLTTQVEHIWTRLYIDDATLHATNGESFAWTDNARSAPTLAHALSHLLAPFFEARYPQHPNFDETLGEREVARLVAAFFGGANTADAGVQHLAEIFAAPLGLASWRGGAFALETGDRLFALPWNRDVLDLADAASGEVVSIAVIDRKLRNAPYGFGREAQHLVLAALVANRRVELATTNGDRISRRTLGQGIRWDDVAGICRAAAILHTAEELTRWANLLTGEETHGSIADPEQREDVRSRLNEWLDAWRAERLLERFDRLPDEALTTRAWNVAAAVRKSFGATAEAIDAALVGDIPLEEGLQRVADAFADSAEVFAHNSKLLDDLRRFTEAFAMRESVRAYLAEAEPTAIDEIESLRRELQSIAADSHTLFDREGITRFDSLWQAFHSRYAEHYATAHDRAMSASRDGRAIDELLRGEKWREFERLSALAIFNPQHWLQTQTLLSGWNEAQCDLDVRRVLAKRAGCVCSFRLSAAARIERASAELEETIERAREAYSRTLALLGKRLVEALETLARKSGDVSLVEAARSLALRFAQRNFGANITQREVHAIAQALQATDAASPLRISLQAIDYGLITRAELNARLKQWLDDLPDYGEFVEVMSRDGNNTTGGNPNEIA
ncbi:MAG: hypothetical protein H0V88_13795 [Pyrinomonadaceae bacterium]|nr:hypothetical protein [Pyrinomonadaceae bacterium]